MSAKTVKIEISFACPGNFPDGWERALDGLIGIVCEQYQRENPTMVMWPAGFGSKMLTNPMAMGDDEKMEFDDSCYSIECAAREDYYGENPYNPERDKLKHRAHIERMVRKGKAVETLVNGVWINAEVKPLPFDFDWDHYDYRMPQP